MKPFLFGLFAVLLSVSAPAQEPGLLAHWELSPDRSQNSGVRAVAGGVALVLSGPTRLVNDPGPSRIELGGRDERITVAPRAELGLLPERDITVETWVRVDRISPWGGMVGYVQDNGDFERGWLLGFTNSHFVFGLATDGGKRLSYLPAAKPFETNRWYHVAGTYDGTVQRLYLNGNLVAEGRGQSGSILYPPKAAFIIGAYQDDDERYPLAGALSRGLGERAVAKTFRSQAKPFPGARAPAAPLPARLRTVRRLARSQKRCRELGNRGGCAHTPCLGMAGRDYSNPRGWGGRSESLRCHPRPRKGS